METFITDKSSRLIKALEKIRQRMIEEGKKKISKQEAFKQIVDEMDKSD